MDALRPLLAEAIKNAGPIRTVCREQMWDYANIRLWFIADKPTMPLSEGLLPILAFALNTAPQKLRKSIVSALEA